MLRKNQTPEEAKIWNMLRNGQLAVKWRRQVSVGPYIADFYCREKQLVIELDGIQHEANKEYDLVREKYFLSLGIRTVRFWNHELQTDLRPAKKKILLAMDQLPGNDDPLRVNYSH